MARQRRSPKEPAHFFAFSPISQDRGTRWPRRSGNRPSLGASPTALIEGQKSDADQNKANRRRNRDEVALLNVHGYVPHHVEQSLRR
jgi:hypothetical protein